LSNFRKDGFLALQFNRVPLTIIERDRFDRSEVRERPGETRG
jgi:hypothetical protein